MMSSLPNRKKCLIVNSLKELSACSVQMKYANGSKMLSDDENTARGRNTENNDRRSQKIEALTTLSFLPPKVESLFVHSSNIECHIRYLVIVDNNFS